jgi:hypothetical protein
MQQDQLFKDLLKEFFREFLELFYPDVAAGLDFTRVTFLDKEVFTDLPEGSLREADLVAQVYTADGQPEIILVHVEVQAQRRGEFPYRMWEYYALLRLRYKLPVFPVVVYLAPGAGGVVQETYTETLFGRDTLTFRYQAVSLPDLNAEDYEENDNPLGPAFSALMRSRVARKVLRRARLLSRRAVTETEEARRTLLLNLITQYLPLSTEEEQEFRRLISQPGYEEAQQMLTVFEQRGIEIGLQQGIEQGIERGIVRGKRDGLLRLARQKFGQLPTDVTARIEAMATAEELDAALDRLLSAATPDDLFTPGQ